MGSIWARYRRLRWWRQALVVSVATGGYADVAVPEPVNVSR